MSLAAFIHRHRLPAEFADSAKGYFLPFAEWLEGNLRRQPNTTQVLGINGAQGTGKSTVAELIGEHLTSTHRRRVAILSIDDIYLTHDARQSLARDVHPLLATRGVPGTHDVDLGIAVIEQLKALQPGEEMLVPRFDKSRDDRCPENDWNRVAGPIDLVIFEGWCVGSQASAANTLRDPVNALESTADADGKWRAYVNTKLESEYTQLFGLIDCLLFLQAPDFDCVQNWRLTQERKLRQSASADATKVMSDEQVVAFIQHYERLTRDNLATLPARADAVIELGRDHQAIFLRYPRAGG